MARCRGSIVWFSCTKGFGFIQHAGGPDLFCPHTALKGDDCTRLEEGTPVEFDVTGPGDAHADNVVLV